jgi:hypothetical protein
MGTCSSVTEDKNQNKQTATSGGKLLKKGTLNRGKTYLAERNNKE